MAKGWMLSMIGCIFCSTAFAKAGNTGITGGMKGINNAVPASASSRGVIIPGVAHGKRVGLPLANSAGPQRARGLAGSPAGSRSLAINSTAAPTQAVYHLTFSPAGHAPITATLGMVQRAVEKGSNEPDGRVFVKGGSAFAINYDNVPTGTTGQFQYRVNGGAVTTVPLKSLAIAEGGAILSARVSLPDPKTTANLEYWFKLAGPDGKVSWDSQNGQNYRASLVPSGWATSL